MNIVVIGNKRNSYTFKILNELIKANIKVKCLIEISQKKNYNFILFKKVSQKIGFIGAVISSFLRIKHKIQDQSFNQVVKSLNFDLNKIQKYSIKGSNSKDMENLISSLDVDLLVIGHTGILKQNILEIPKIGTLNSHPGILPYYKGLDSIYWACFNKDFSNIGTTVHFVDKGIDTGDIVVRKFLDINPLNKNLLQTRKDLINFSSTVMKDAVLKIIESKNKENIEVLKNESGSYYSKIPFSKYRLAKQYFKKR